jgi:hypothetical protein
MDVAVAEMAEAGNARTGLACLACPRHGSTARVERADDSVEDLSRGPKSALEAQNEVASILRYRLG